MNLFNLMGQPNLPGILVFQPSGLLDFPSSVEVTDRWANVGSGVGSGSNSIKTALGEYYERRHFYKEVISNGKGVLSDFLASDEVDSFTKVFLQTSSKKTFSEEVITHNFMVAPAIRVSDFSVCHIPTVCVSLSWNGLELDSPMYPLRDTCGCSFHWDPEMAFLGSVKEHLERQFLLRFWLTKMCNSSLSVEQIRRLLNKKKSLHLYEALMASGEISVFDISDYDFPGVCVLTVYGQSKDSRHVHYCAGMSFASETGEALEKSIFELWQTYRFMDLFSSLKADKEIIKDPYLQYFLDCNLYSTYLEVTDVLFSSCRKAKSEVNFDFSGLRLSLERKNITGYLYAHVSTVGGVGCVFSKYLSPDLFMHMNSAQDINIFNKYSDSFRGHIIPSRLTAMVPFP